jgi:protein-S-isoprenylcysteine O-methyltransferase Ste14
MKASSFEYRYRFLVHALIYVLGFFSPWNRWLHLDSIRTWQYLAAWPARTGWLSFSTATIVVLILGILCAFAGAFLRTWGTAYLSPSVVQDGAMHGEGLLAAGPFRFLRNPLYLGTFLHTLALVLLMPPSGAIFTILAIGLLQLRLIGAEEPFLTARLGAPYLAYCAKVPRLIPALTPRVPAPNPQSHDEKSAGNQEKANWAKAFAGEIYMWGVFLSFATLGWRYNSMLILKGVIISFGISLIARALIPKP